MPTINSFATHPTRPYVRVETDWTDSPTVEYVRVVRVDEATGTETSLRPYICFDGDCLKLTCGQAIFWDTEAPLDRAFHYRAEPCNPADLCISTPSAATSLVYDSFTRIVANGWGSADTGQAYTVMGPAADYAVNGTQGLMTVSAVSSGRSALLGTGTTDVDETIQFTVPAVATGGSYFAYLAGRGTDDANFYYARLEFNTAGNATLAIARFVASASTILDTFALGPYLAGQTWSIRLAVIDSQIQAKAWLTSGVQPTVWQAQATDTFFTTGTLAGARMFAGLANTNVPFTGTFDNFAVNDCAHCTTVTVSTAPQTIVSTGIFWLKDPVRPCHDRPVPLCTDGISEYPACLPADAITFLTVGTELYEPNATRIRPMNRRRPIPIVRQRRDASTVLRLATSTFGARDDLYQLLIPGSALLFQGPGIYGVPDRYMDVGTVNSDALTADLRWQVREHGLPYETVDRPSGPSQGICGAQVSDLCDVYATWDAMQAAGVTYAGLLRGAASTELGGA